MADTWSAEQLDNPRIPLPKVDELNRYYWTGGERGELCFLRCVDCGTYLHPPAPVCPQCHSTSVAPSAVSGLGYLLTFTINRQQWVPDVEPPYAVGVIELPEQPGLRVTTSLVGLELDDIEIGMALRVAFVPRDDVWIPVFTSTDETPAPRPDPPLPPHTRPRRAPRTIGERAAVISGSGQSAVGRRLYRHPLDLTVEASLQAIRAAGLTTDDIDGISTYPGAAEVSPGLSGVGVFDVKDALRLEVDWFSGGSEAPGQFGSILNACAAVAAGYANHVLCFRTVWESSAQGNSGRQAVVGVKGNDDATPARVTGLMQWLMPYAIPSAASWLALNARRHFHEFGTTREQLGWIAVVQRAHAALNPVAIYRDPMTIDDYLTARLISDPLCLFDCDVPCDGSTAFVISRSDAAADLRRPPIAINAASGAFWGRPSWDQFDDLTTMALRDAAQGLWQRTELTPGDVDVAELYDGFSFTTLAWIEALGFCARGEGGPFVEGGARIALDGELPLNTHGGQLSAGRLHGYGFLHEACAQLWGDGGARQVVRDGGRRPEVAIAAAGGGPYAAAMLLTR